MARPRLPRIIESVLEAAIRAVPVVVLEGGRAVGKSTTCDVLIDRHGWGRRVDLSGPGVLATLRLDPERFLRTLPTPCVIDEAQLEPDLTIWVKRVVDSRPGAGQFLLTGSARLGRDQLGGSDPLAGRSVRLRMWSMTESEICGRSSTVLDDAFGDGWEDGTTGTTGTAVTADDEPRSHWRGGLPGLSGVLAPADVNQWEREIAAYVESTLPLAAGSTRADLGRLLRSFRYLAANSGQLLNLARAANDLGMQAPTVRAHLELLESAFLLARAEAERPAEHRVVTSHPRVFASDVGLAIWAARAWAAPMNAVTLGSMTETSIAHDLFALADAASARIAVRHWRDARNRHDVDLLLVHPDGRCVAVEVKASTSVGPGDTLGLQRFAAEAGDRCHRCVLVFEGERVVDLTPPGERCQIVAIPRALL